MRRPTVMTAAVLATLAAPAGAVTRDDGVPDARYLELGRQMRPYTAAVSCTNPDGERHNATAVLVAGRWAVTAAHVVAGCTDVRLVYDGSQRRAVDQVVLHPGWQHEVMGTPDVALLRTTEDCGLPWYPPIAHGVTPGESVIVAGYGVTGTMRQGFDIADGRLRAGTNTVDRIEGVTLVCVANQRGSSMEAMIGPGDSGGPLFVGSGSGARLAAINSHQVGPRAPLRSRYGEESGHILLHAVRPWMAAVIEGTPHGSHEPAEGEKR